MKRILYIIFVMLTITGCEDMKMDKNVEKQISLD